MVLNFILRLNNSIKFLVWLVLHIRQEDIPEDGDEVDIKDAILGGDQSEVDRLARRPDDPVKQVDGGELGLELLPARTCNVS